MNPKKIWAAVVGVILMSSFVFFLLGITSYIHFLAVAAISAYFAWKVLPKIK